MAWKVKGSMFPYPPLAVFVNGKPGVHTPCAFADTVDDARTAAALLAPDPARPWIKQKEIVVTDGGAEVARFVTRW